MESGDFHSASDSNIDSSAGAEREAVLQRAGTGGGGGGRDLLRRLQQGGLPVLLQDDDAFHTESAEEFRGIRERLLPAAGGGDTRRLRGILRRPRQSWALQRNGILRK